MKKDVPLTSLQRTVLELFFEKPIGQKYFLTGGTALAGFYFKHRKSIDLDLFTFEDIEVKYIEAILTDIAKQTNTKLDHRVATKNFHLFFLTGKDKELKIDFVKEQPVHFGRTKNFGRIRVDSIENIGSNKITAILGRTEAKDFPEILVPFNKDVMVEYFVNQANKLLLNAKPSF